MKRYLVSFNYGGLCYAELAYANSEDGAIDAVDEKLIRMAAKTCGENADDIANNINKGNFTVEEVQ